MSQPPHLSHSSQPAATDGSSIITSIDEAADVALEPLRLGFQNYLVEPECSSDHGQDASSKQTK